MIYSGKRFCSVKYCSWFCYYIYRHIQSSFCRIIIPFILFLVIFIVYISSLNQSNDIDSAKFQWTEKNRNISNFLHRKHKVSHEGKCTKNTDVVISVLSAPVHFSARNAVRNAWKSILPPNWTLLFFIGTSENGLNEGEEKEERINYEDIIQLNVKDDYLNLTIKMTLLLEWMNHQCKSSKFLLKVDDDVFLNLDNMEKLITCIKFSFENKHNLELPSSCNQWQTKLFENQFLDSKSGKLISYAALGYLYEGIEPDRNKYSKYYLSYELFPDSVFPDFLSGTSYLISTNLIPMILQEALRTPLIILEDVYITGIILNRSLKIKLGHVDGWNKFRPRFNDVCLFKLILTAHGLNPDQITSITRSVSDMEGNCGPLRTLFAYFGKWLLYYYPAYEKTPIV